MSVATSVIGTFEFAVGLTALWLLSLRMFGYAARAIVGRSDRVQRAGLLQPAMSRVLVGSEALGVLGFNGATRLRGDDTMTAVRTNIVALTDACARMAHTGTIACVRMCRS